jgi:NitT/TauT family transport system permease protein
VAWQLVVSSGWKPDYVLPGPITVFRELTKDATSSRFYQALFTTFLRALKGYAIAVVVGVAVGALVAQVKSFRSAVGALITGLQTMPSIVWFPLAILLFRLSEGAILFVVVVGAAPSIANGLISGVDHVPPLLLRAGRVLGAKKIRLYHHVIGPASLPSFLSGLKQGWAFAWRGLMAGELIVQFGKPSLGGSLDEARQFSDAPALLGGMIVVLIIGILIDTLFSYVDRGIRRRRGLFGN